MHLEVTVGGKVGHPDRLVNHLKGLAKRKGYRLGAWKEGCRLVLCPMGYLDLGWVRERGLLAGWRVSGGCTTTPGGPGLHHALAEVLDTLPKGVLKQMEVRDETGFFHHRDVARVGREHYLPWLADWREQVCGEVVRHPEGACWGFEPDQYRPVLEPGTVATPLGRFPAEWLERRSLEELAQRIFLWEEPGQNPRMLRNVALKRLWEDCWFAPSRRSGEDAQVNRQIVEGLERAALGDGELPLPLEEYRAVCQLEGRTPRLREGTSVLVEPCAIGYRKGEVFQAFDRLWVPLPGIYRYEWSEDRSGSGGIWWDSEGASPIWRFNGFRSPSGRAEFTLDLSRLQDFHEGTVDGAPVRWGWATVPGWGDPEEVMYQMVCEVLVGDTLYRITVTYGEPEERADIVSRLSRILLS